ncbi:MAG: dihydrofolate reductase [Planctomycetes bacterium]|nr:dihydrofolate reductase [Planctomycetota bacterium]
MPLTIIVAMSENRVIGRDGDLPWRLPEDLKRFKRLTTGHHVIMGRKTFETLGRPLPNRTNIVITRRQDFPAPGDIRIAHSLEEALGLAESDVEPFVLGGGEIYALALPLAGRLELTVIHATIPGDTYFPDYDESEWTLVADDRHEADENHEHPFSFRTYQRERPG